jgi:hypothetical protein
MTPMQGDDDDGDLNTIPLGIVRRAMDVMDVWRGCHRRACKRGRACRGRQVQCAGERPPRKQSNNPEKTQRDQARSMAIFQRALRERTALDDGKPQESRDESASRPAPRKTHR